MGYRVLGIDDKMPFGKYKDKEIGEIIDEDPKYMSWVLENTALEVDSQTLDMVRREVENARRSQR